MPKTSRQQSRSAAVNTTVEMQAIVKPIKLSTAEFCNRVRRMLWLVNLSRKRTADNALKCS
jgi:hypothetical protein